MSYPPDTPTDLDDIPTKPCPLCKVEMDYDHEACGWACRQGDPAGPCGGYIEDTDGEDPENDAYDLAGDR